MKSTNKHKMNSTKRLWLSGGIIALAALAFGLSASGMVDFNALTGALLRRSLAPCLRPPANIVAGSCYDRITRKATAKNPEQRYELYQFTCLPGYKKRNNRECISKDPAVTGGSFVIRLWQKAQENRCVKNVCADMKGGRPEEVAFCNFAKRDGEGGGASYGWYDSPLSRGDAVTLAVVGLNPDTPTPAAETPFPYKDVNDLGYRITVWAAYLSGMIGKMPNDLFRTDDPATESFVKDLLKKAKADKVKCDLGAKPEEGGREDDKQPRVEGTLRGSMTGGLYKGGFLTSGASAMANRYILSAQREGFRIEKITVVNDLEGPFDRGENTLVAEMVNLIRDGKPVATAFFSGGEATFSFADMEVPKDTDIALDLQVQAQAAGVVGETFSNQKVRLGIRNVQAVGLNSAKSVTLTGEQFANPNVAPLFVTRKSVPTFTADKASTALINGSNTLYGLSVAANPAGAVSLAKISFIITASDVQSIGNLRLVRGNSQVPESAVAFYDAATGQKVTSLKAGINRIEARFLQEETVSSGLKTAYRLTGDVTGAKTNSAVATSLNFFDEYIVANALPSDAVFVWSDRSADTHIFGGGNDWFNGYSLGLIDLTAQTLVQ